MREAPFYTHSHPAPGETLPTIHAIYQGYLAYYTSYILEVPMYTRGKVDTIPAIYRGIRETPHLSDIR